MAMGAENILSLVGMIVVIGFFTVLLVSIGWQLLKYVAIFLGVGCVVMYFGSIFMIVTRFSWYWNLLMNGDQEAFWATVYIVVVTLGILGYSLWNFGGFSLPRFKRQKQPRQEQESQNKHKEQTYFQPNMELRLRDLELLGLDRTASQEEIKKTYRQLSKKYHPDINPDPHAAIIFKQIQKAYDNLIN